MTSSRLIRQLDLTTLSLFVAIFEEGTLTRAAQREAIAISAASKRLAALEDAVGTALLQRSARGMALTSAGESMLHYARRLLCMFQSIDSELAGHAAGVRGYVRMTANLSAIVEYLPEDLRAFLTMHDQIKIDLEERPSSAIVDGVLLGLAQIGVCSGDVDTYGLAVAHYRWDRLCVITPSDHPLKQHKSVTFAETLDFDHVGLNSASSINARIHLAARRAGKALRLQIQVPSFDAVCRMVQARMSVAIIPHAVFDAMGRHLRLEVVPLTEEWSTRNLVIVAREITALSPVARLLFNYLGSVEAAIS